MNNAQHIQPAKYSQISQAPLTQYISNNSHIVASISSKVQQVNVNPVEKERKQAQYKPASPPSPPSHMNKQRVEVQVHVSCNAPITQNTPTQQTMQDPLQGSWSSWNGQADTYPTEPTQTEATLSSIQKHQEYEQQLFKRSDAQAMLDLFLIRLDEEERQEEIVRNAVQNPIRTFSAYNAFIENRARNAPVNTLSKVVETSPIFQEPKVPKIKTVRPKNTKKSLKNQQMSVDKIKKVRFGN